MYKVTIVSLKSIEGIEEAEKLQEKGYKATSYGLDTVAMVYED